MFDCNLHVCLYWQARFPGNQVLQQELDDWVTEHEAAAERKRKAAEAASDDGWTVVKRSKVQHTQYSIFEQQHPLAPAPPHAEYAQVARACS